MRLFRDYTEAFRAKIGTTVVTVGNFDGVHLGHRAVLHRARVEADSLGLELAAMTFEPHPESFLRPSAERMRLIEPGRKVELLAEAGAAIVLAQRFDGTFAALDSDAFADKILCRALGARHVIVGENFRFGRGRTGDIESLRAAGERLGFEVHGERLVRVGDMEVSSSRIRALVSAGEVALARRLLGRLHEIPGTVVRGLGQGRSLGFPTINLSEVEVLAPGPGIYAALAEVGGEAWPAAAYTGTRPTTGGGPTLEAHLLGFSGDLYGRRVTLRFVEKLRGERTFEDVEALKAQIRADVALARRVLEETLG
ncbi:MAG: riboflavin biosynthesis protein RibF [Deltaproteobacteria bacterium]|nr:riboflavin biosynthesis protein RibF [Deltaproteobacteria bacterium]